MRDDRRSLLKGFAALPLVAASVPALAVGQPTGPDPSFTLIKAHQVAWNRFGAVLGEFSGKIKDEPPEYAARVEAAAEAETEAAEALLTPEPTTLAGLRALAEYMLAHDVRANGPIHRDEHTRWALETIACTCRSLIPANGGMA